MVDEVRTPWVGRERFSGSGTRPGPQPTDLVVQVAVPRSRNVAMRVCYYPPRTGDMLRLAGNGTPGGRGPGDDGARGIAHWMLPGALKELRECVLPGRKGEKEEERAKREEKNKIHGAGVMRGS